MFEVMFWGFAVRFLQCLVQATPFILVGLFIAGIFRRLLRDDGTRRLFGEGTPRSLLQAWAVGMLLPVCSLGVIPVIREMRRVGLAGGTILAFAMSAPLFNPLSLLYGLTLSEPVAILLFAFCSLIVVTLVGFVWDRLFPGSGEVQETVRPVGHGPKRMLSILVVAAREVSGPSLPWLLVGLAGVAMLGALLPSTALQHSVNGDDPLAPLTMTAVAVPVYATPMLAMSQLGSMFQHANSPGAAFVLLALGAGMNLGLAWWMFRHYGAKKALAWFALLLLIVVGLAYGVDRPLFPRDIEIADHTHAFDVYCRPFESASSNLPAMAMDKLKRDTQPYERTAVMLLGGLLLLGLGLRLLDRWLVIEDWLERTAEEPASTKGLDIVIPGPVLGGLSLAGLIAASIVGCYAYYPPPEEVLEEMSIVKAEALGGALSGDVTHATYWIDAYDDWSRKLEVGVYLRDWRLSDYHRWKARLLREKLELLQHEVEDHDMDEVRRLVADISRTHQRLRRAYLEER
jgi:uncharacterized protein